MAKNPNKSKKSSSRPGGTLMNMRSGFQKMTGSKRSRTTRSKWTFQQVLMAVAGAAALIALVYAMSR